MSERISNRRIRLLVVSFALVFAITLGRAAWVQAVHHGRFAKMATTQHRETIEIPAGRGTIYDRTGDPLAIGEQATTVYADPRAIVVTATTSRRRGDEPRRPAGCRRARVWLRERACG